tara:strand:- start:1295 stop:1891 length:597 start_codon:yes stop_codon:yes gene_type:complete
MNFLAHLHLAEPTPESLLGNLLGDFVKGYPWDNRFPEAVWKGIVEHRAVDAFTDQHPQWKRSRDLLPGHLRRFAGIVVDVYYDFFLHRHWETFSDGSSIDEFILSAHSKLDSALHLAPEESAVVIRQMMQERWLACYGSLDGVESTLFRVSKRSPVMAPVFEASAELRGHVPAMEEHFLQFYPDLIDHVKSFRAANSG